MAIQYDAFNRQRIEGKLSDGRDVPELAMPLMYQWNQKAEGQP